MGVDSVGVFLLTGAMRWWRWVFGWLWLTFVLLLGRGVGADQDFTAIHVLFHNVYGVMGDGRQVKLRFRQMGFDSVLPAMSPNSRGFERARACQVCNRNGYFTKTQEELPEFIYGATAVRSAKDVVASFENVGFARLGATLKESLLSKPWLLVSPRVRRLLVHAGVHEVDWIPIAVEE